MVKLSLNRLEQDQTGKIMLVIAKHDEITRSNRNNQEKSGIFLHNEIHLLHNMVKLVGLNWIELERTKRESTPLTWFTS